MTEPAAPVDDFEFLPPAEESEPAALEERLQRAELFMRLPGVVNYGQPLDDIFAALSEYIVANTSAIAAAVTLVRPADVTTIAKGSCNLPEGYLEGMYAVRRNTLHGARLVDSAVGGQTWILRNARNYMLSFPEYEPLYPQIRAASFETVVGTPFPSQPETVGFIYLYYAAGVPVDSSAIAFSRALAAFARPLVDNALLFQEAERRTAELEALTRADQALHQSLELDDVYQALIDLAVELFGADRSLFLTFDEHGRFHARVTRGVPEEHLAGLQPIYQRMRREDIGERSMQVRMVEDIDESELQPGVREFTTSRSTVDIPVFVEGEFFGIFVLGYHHPRSFTEDDRRQFDTLSARAGLAIHNALLFRESRRRTSELEALRRADDALHRSLRLNDVMQAMVELAANLLNADSSLLATFKPDGHLGVIASKGLSDRVLEAVNATYEKFDHAYFERLGKPAPIVVVEDIRQEGMVDPRLHNAAVGSTAEIPVVVEDEVWGVFSVGWRTRKTFTAGDRAMFEAFGSRASLAIQNALNFEESERRSNELEALARADEALHRSLNLEDVQEAMVELAVELLGATTSLVATWDTNDRLEVRTNRGIPDALLVLVNERYQRLGRDYFAERERGAEPAFVGEVSGHPRLADFEIPLRGSLAEIPIFVGDEPWGFFAVGWRAQRQFSEDDRRLIDTFANRASLAIQNAVLFERAQLTASIEERQRIARDLHDSVSQALYGIGLGARTLKRKLGDNPPAGVSDPVDFILNLAEGGLAETRALIFELMPDSLKTDGLVTALQRQAAAIQARHNVKVAAVLCDEPELPLRTKEALYRIAQESLNNMAKHAHATEATVRFEPAGAGFLLRIQDNGRGFDTGQEFPGHLGLRSMAERAAKAGGEYRIESAPGEGTIVSVVIH